MLVKVFIVSIGVEASQHIPLIILKEENGDRTLPIALGNVEAQTIAMLSMDVIPDRPLTIDCAFRIMEVMGGKLLRIVIKDLAKQVFYAQLQIKKDNEVYSIDCRPSDAIALALRSNAPLFLEEIVFEKCGLGKHASEKDKLKHTISSMNTIDFGQYYLE